MIDIKITKITEGDGTYFEVQIGPDGHVCRSVRTFWVDGRHRTLTDAEHEARLFAQGARAAIETAGQLAVRFLTPSAIQ